MDATGTIEKAAKASTLLALATAASGYIVVSLYESSFGYVSANPFRPKVVAAGGLLFLFAGSPFYAGSFIGTTYTWKASEWKSDFVSAAMLALLSQAILASFFRLLIIHISEGEVSRALGWVVLETLGIALVGIGASRGWPSSVAGIAVTLILLPVLVAEMIRGVKFIPDLKLSIWLLILIVFGMVYGGIVRHLQTSAKILLGYSAPFALAIVFSIWMYPSIDAGWGGGRPGRVELLLSKESFSPNLRVQRYLLDETDAGLYLSDTPQGRTQFVPRTAIALVTYLGQ